jgi:hypothetical protein
VGAGKLYPSLAAFEADRDAWDQEHAEHKQKMAERKRMLDKQRDRSGRERGSEQETDSERVVRQRQENAAAATDHAQQQAAQRQKSRLTQQQAWARDVGVFADVCSCAAPYSHPLAYSHHLRGDWLQDGVRICALRDYIATNPPSGDADWEIDVDNKAYELWGKEGCVRDGYLMLIQLPSAPKPRCARMGLTRQATQSTAGELSVTDWGRCRAGKRRLQRGTCSHPRIRSCPQMRWSSSIVEGHALRRCGISSAASSSSANAAIVGTTTQCRATRRITSPSIATLRGTSFTWAARCMWRDAQSR